MQKKRLLLLFVALLLQVVSSHAGLFQWSYSGAAYEDDPAFFPPQAMRGSGFIATGRAAAPHGRPGLLVSQMTGTWSVFSSGIWNDFAITGLLPTDPASPFYFFNDNVLYYPAVSNSRSFHFLDVEGLGFSVSDGTGVNLLWDGSGLYFAAASAIPPYGFTDFSGASFGTFAVTSVPEPSSCLLVLVAISTLVFFPRSGPLGERRGSRGAAVFRRVESGPLATGRR